jgi:hypothetical protein
MKTSKLTSLMGLMITMGLSIVAMGSAQSMLQGKGPVITNFYAADKGPYGMVWKIYIEAESRDADMSRIAVVVDQPGQGRYPTDIILLDPQHRNHLKGYLQWNTLSPAGSALQEGTQITLGLHVIDRSGKESNEVTLPFTFVQSVIRQNEPSSGINEQEKFPSPFDKSDLPRIGNISVELTGQGSGGH